jgi:hypothetical protein
MYNNNVLSTMKKIADPNVKMTDKLIAIFLSVTLGSAYVFANTLQGKTVLPSLAPAQPVENRAQE